MHPAEWLTPAIMIALAGLVWRGFERISSRMDRLESRVDSGFLRSDAKSDSLSEQVKQIAIDVAVLKDRSNRDSGHAPHAAANG